MNLKTCLIIFGMIAMSSLNGVKAQRMAVKMMDGTEQAYAVTSLSKVTFYDSNLVLDEISGETQSYKLSNIRKIYFSDLTSVTDLDLTGATALTVYPNPAGDWIHIRNIPDQISVAKIYRLDGRVVSQVSLSSVDNTIDISSLKSGLYLLSVGGKALKFMKL